MIRDVLQEIGGIGLYGLISLTLFFAVFILMLVKVLRMKPSERNHHKQLPLEDGASTFHAGDRHHE